jgi:hypothetical protein
VLFSEPVEPASATNAANYALNLGASVTAARFAGDNRTVVLDTSPLGSGLIYTLTVNNVRDLAATPNTILPNSQVQISTTFTPVNMDFIKGTAEPPGPSSRRTGLAITEIMYHPADRVDGRNLEFIELFNSEAANRCRWTAGGLRARWTTPSHPAPPSPRAAIWWWPQFRRIFSLSMASATSSARSPAICPTVPAWSDCAMRRVRSCWKWNIRTPRPGRLAADGAGHSLVLARPSYGEADVRAWAASDLVGGSPGAADVASADPYRTIVINELLIHTDLPQQDFVELYNYSSAGGGLVRLHVERPARHRQVCHPECDGDSGGRICGVHGNATGFCPQHVWARTFTSRIPPARG